VDGLDISVSLRSPEVDPALEQPGAASQFSPVADLEPGPRPIVVDRVDASVLVGYQTAWADLCSRTLEANVFLEPAFALPLFQHVARELRPTFLLIWEENGPASFGRLLGLFPLGSLGSPRSMGIARAFAHDQTACGTPLVDRHRAPDVFAAVLSWLSAQRHRAHALVIPGVPAAGAFHAATLAFCDATARGVQALDTHERAVLRRPGDGQAPPASASSAKRRKEQARQARRLSELGTRAYVSAQSPPDVAAATERFLALEHSGWKGKRGTALLANFKLATFTRTMTRLMAHEGTCRIDSIEVNGRPVAMGIVLSVNDRAYFWKTAFDESYASLSPGVQFATELTRAQLAMSSVALTDSCAIENHPMIDKLWPERMAVTDLVIAVTPGDTRRFAACTKIERGRRHLRRKVKTLWHTLRRASAN
jgi:CelD/BcsL family acetyltransferase involved in cellulose biosynthesis